MFSQLKQNYFKVILGATLVMIALFFGSRLVSVSDVFAQGYVDTTKTTEGDKGGFVLCGNTASTPCTIGHLFAAFIVIINYLIAMAGFIAVVAIVFAGFMMIYSQGQEQLKAAKGRFAGAVIGLILVAAAYLLINSLISGRFSIGVCDDKLILASPLEYIKNYNACKGASSGTNTNTVANANGNTNTVPIKRKFQWAYGGLGLPSDEILGTNNPLQAFAFVDDGDGDCGALAFSSIKSFLIKTASACADPNSGNGAPYNYYEKGDRFWGGYAIESPNFYENQASQPNSALMYGPEGQTLCTSTSQQNCCASFAQAGCGPTVFSMLLQRLNSAYPNDRSQEMIEGLRDEPNFLQPWELGERFVENGFRNCPTEPGSRHDVVLKNFNLYFPNWQVNHRKYHDTNWINKSSSEISSLKSDLVRHLSLDTGYAIAVVGKGRVFTMNGHFILLFGACTGQNGCYGSGLNYINVADPYSASNVALIEVGELAREIKAITFVGK